MPDVTIVSRIKAAELLSVAGALLVGGALGAWVRDVVSLFVWASIGVIGLIAHATGMLVKHQIEQRSSPIIPRWTLWTYRICWASIAAALMAIAYVLLK